MEGLTLDNIIIEKDIVECFVDELGIKLSSILEKNIDFETGHINVGVSQEIKSIRIKKALILEKKR